MIRKLKQIGNKAGPWTLWRGTQLLKVEPAVLLQSLIRQEVLRNIIERLSHYLMVFITFFRPFRINRWHNREYRKCVAQIRFILPISRESRKCLCNFVFDAGPVYNIKFQFK